MPDRPKVSVAMITYNHERFIVRAVESVLEQRGDFDFEIVIGEDGSTDGTRERLLELKRQSPNRIRLLLRERNIGMQDNFIGVLSACRGEYVALLEGDDYWTDAEKLRRQVKLLDERPEVAICHHNALRFYDDDSRPTLAWHQTPPPALAPVDDLLRENFIVTCTAMFRNGRIGGFPDWFRRGRFCDWTLHVLNAQHGGIAYIDRVMAAYRQHAGGIWTGLPQIERHRWMAETARLMRESLPERQRAILDRAVGEWTARAVELAWREGLPSTPEEHALARSARPAAYQRLSHFYCAIELERAGRRWQAAGHLLRAVPRGWRQTHVGLADIGLALSRVVCPSGYRALRTLWRFGRR